MLQVLGQRPACPVCAHTQTAPARPQPHLQVTRLLLGASQPQQVRVFATSKPKATIEAGCIDTFDACEPE